MSGDGVVVVQSSTSVIYHIAQELIQHTVTIPSIRPIPGSTVLVQYVYDLHNGICSRDWYQSQQWDWRLTKHPINPLGLIGLSIPILIPISFVIGSQVIGVMSHSLHRLYLE